MPRPGRQSTVGAMMATEMHETTAAEEPEDPPEPGTFFALAREYLPDVVYGANDGVITTFAVVAGVVGAALSETVILILGFANLVADGFSMGASNYLARRSHAETTREGRRPAARKGLATSASFVVVGAVPLVAYLVPLPDDWRFPAAVALTLATLFVFGASRTLVTRVGWLRSGLEMLLVGAAAALVAYGIGAFAAGLPGGGG
jgi:VIT1/CCC1 family predicted Fe2+/Mn2+ transporter